MEFEKNRFRVAKTCPCGKSNRDGKFSPLKGYTDKGKCHSCGQFFPPVEPMNAFKFPYECIGVQCNLYKYLITVLDRDKVDNAWKAYKIGGRDGYTIFPMINKNNDIVTAKSMLYNSDGKRNRNIAPKYIHYNGYKFEHPLFGEHLVTANDIVNVCESEKSAVIASIVLGGIWVATCGKSQLNLINRIKNVKVLYPDNDAIDEWSSYGNIQYTYLNAIKDKPKGYDVGDYCLDLVRNKKIVVNLSDKSHLIPSQLQHLAEVFELKVLECNDINYITLCDNLKLLTTLLSDSSISNTYSNDRITIRDVRRYIEEKQRLRDWYNTEYKDLFSDDFALINELANYYSQKYSIKIL